ncbi:hypothetical protein HanRHA438_Chr01g0030791 [Helianthus annuus]|nr:hypothetical protein HanRHA438_Chr01g0030791 [Helianthus annuus]
MPSNCLHNLNSATSSTKSMVDAMLQMLWKFLTSELSALGLFLQILWLASNQDYDQHLLENIVKKECERRILKNSFLLQSFSFKQVHGTSSNVLSLSDDVLYPVLLTQVHLGVVMLHASSAANNISIFINPCS